MAVAVIMIGISYFVILYFMGFEKENALGWKELRIR